MEWFALYTKPRNEKRVAENLAALGIEAYCPLVITIKQWSDRKKKVASPLIPSYVFVKIEEANRKDVFQVAGVVQYVFWLGKPAKIKPHEIEALKTQLAAPVVKVDIETWIPNTAVQIKEGPFKNQMAEVDKISANKVTLIIKSLGIRLIIAL
ncbi:transcription termination/antitermination protein NusG [Flavobacterium sp.]|jgi:transcriptional antiterminator RfaH|uniref:transcription termination/antitermination protein NusG n=1 Tax=Flavobacterium sp. TaxID=239 RepID=UPI0037BE94DD